ncbi:MAG TPA: COR domain-containing protein, partial [Puia sp.]|nr:COR domain-containing protein [Puia sp.]
VKICMNNHITDPQMQEVLAGFLHDLGVIVRFKGLNLSNVYILQPKWVSQAAYKIINSKKIADNHGVLLKDDLNVILRKEREGDFYFPLHFFSYILTLLERFEICFALSEDKYLLPELLDIQQPKLPIQHGECIRFYFEYESLLPSSIFTRFVVRMNQDIWNNLCWRTGVVLAVDVFSSTAIIVVDPKERRIHISVDGEGRREHFAIIRKTFHDLHNSFEKLKVVEMIALPVENKFIAYSELVAYNKHGKEEYFSGELERNFNVKEILDTIEPENTRTRKYQWDVFLIHASADKRLISAITDDLKAKKITYWLDDEQLMPGDDLLEGIKQGLMNSGVLIPCLSRNQKRSNWTLTEYSSILNRMISGYSDQRVAPLVLDNMPEEDIDIFLASRKWIRYQDKDQYGKLLDFLTRKKW